MTGFNFNTAAPTNTQTIDKQHIDSGDFWPVIDLDELRRDMRIDTTITPDRLFETAINAVAYVNDQLKDIGAIVPLAQHISQTDPRRINGEPLANIRHAATLNKRPPKTTAEKAITPSPSCSKSRASIAS